MKKALLIIRIGLAFTFFAAPGFAIEHSDVQIHGFISQGFISSTENNFVADSKDGTFEFNEMGINFSKKLTSRLHIGLQLFARDFGATGDNEVKIDWALVDYRIVDWLGLRFGQLKAPRGFYNEYRDVDALRTFIFLPQSIYKEILRDITLSIQGGGLYGLIDMHAAGQLTYQALYGTQTIEGHNNRLVEALSGIAISAFENDSNDLDVKYIGSLAYDTPVTGLRLGVSYDNIEMKITGHSTQDVLGIVPVNTPVDISIDAFENWVYSLEYAWQNLTIMAEYLDSNMEFGVTVAPVIDQEGTVEQSGWYVGATYRLTDWFEVGAYYSDLESESDLPLISLPDYYEQLTDICATTRLDLNEYWTLKLEYHTFTGAKGLSSMDNPSGTISDAFGVGDFEKDWTMFVAKLTVAF
jgi:hypothetical protein